MMLKRFNRRCAFNNGWRPTFVSIDDFEEPEWNTAADGPLKEKTSL
jgi:uncharacterized protein (DUF2126 family)